MWTVCLTQSDAATWQKWRFNIEKKEEIAGELVINKENTAVELTWFYFNLGCVL